MSIDIEMASSKCTKPYRPFYGKQPLHSNVQLSYWFLGKAQTREKMSVYITSSELNANFLHPVRWYNLNEGRKSIDKIAKILSSNFQEMGLGFNKCPSILPLMKAYKNLQFDVKFENNVQIYSFYQIYFLM